MSDLTSVAPDWRQRAFPMFEWIAGVIESGGYVGLFFLAFLENLFPPVPSELIMPFGGYLARQGKMNFFGAVLVGATGATLGSLPLYSAGRMLGKNRIRALVERWGGWAGLSGDDIEKADQWFVAHRAASVFWCRILPGVRTYIAIPAGLNRMPVTQFALYTWAGSGVWTLFLATAGYFLGAAFASIDKFLGPASYVVVGGLVAFGVWKLYRRKRKAEKSQSATVSHSS